MALHFHTLTVKNIRRETPECVSVAFDIPETLQKEFEFVHGQSINIRVFDKQEEIRRSYSICSSPGEKELRIAVKKVNGGYFSSYANQQLKVGDQLEVMSPSGNFYTRLNPANSKNYMAFAAGSGITPVISIIKSTLTTEPQSTFVLVYGNRNTGSIIFKEELEGLKNKYMERFMLIHVLSGEKTESQINEGRIDAEKCRQLAKLVNPATIDEYFLCGPEQMIFGVRDYLLQTGIDSKKIHFELFTTPLRQNNKIVTESTETASQAQATITVKVDGRSFDFNLAYNGRNILDAALAEGADLPFACKGGVCCTCKAKLVMGKVDMEVNYGLEADEVEAGFILTCQSHPRTEKVVVDYDVK